MMKKVLIVIITALIVVLINETVAQVINRNPDKAYLKEKNLITTNPGAEQGTASWSETGSGALTLESTAANVGFGSHSIGFDAAAASDRLDSPSTITIPPALYGKNCMARIRYKGGDTNLDFEVHDASNNTVVEKDLSAASTFRTEILNFICPSSATTYSIAIVAAANAAIVYIDDVFIGEADNVGSIQQAEMVAGIYYPATASCTPTVDNTSFTNAPAVAACPAPSVQYSNPNYSLNTSDDNELNLVIDNLPAGLYEITAMITVQDPNAAVTDMHARIAGDSQSGYPCISDNDVTGSETQLICKLLYEKTSQSNVNYRIQLRESSAGAMTLLNDNGGVGGDGRVTQWFIKRWPKGSDTVTAFNSHYWFTSGTIGGATPGIAGSTTAYTSIASATLSRQAQHEVGGVTTQIGCDSTNSPTGDTCSVGNEEIAVAISGIPRAGRVEVCFQFLEEYDMPNSAQDVETYFSIREVDPDTGAIRQSGVNVSGSRNKPETANNDHFLAWNHTLCDTFLLTSTRQTEFNLYVEVNGGTATGHRIMADRGTSQGDRAVYYSVRPIDQQEPMPVIVNSVATTSAGSVRLVSAKVDGTGTPSVTREDGDWIDSITDNGTGDWTLNIVSGTFSIAPNCTVSNAANSAISTAFLRATQSTSAVQVGAARTDTQAAVDLEFDIVCVGER